MEESNMSASQPEPVDLSHYYSKVTKSRNKSSVKDFYKYFLIPGIGNIAGGMPNNNYFPYDTLEATVALPDRFVPTPNIPLNPPTSASSLSDKLTSSHILVPKASSASNLLRKIDLKSALQYGTAQGYPPLYYFLRQFTRLNLHPNVPYAGGPEIILTCGATDGFAKTLEALTNTWNEDRDWIREREGVLVEEFTYMNAVQAVTPRGLNVVPVAIDNEGMMASGKGGLGEVLEYWDFAKGKRPHLIYTVTIGQNPTSGILSLQRRKEIYTLCTKYDVIIVEDDPYWYLQYPSAIASSHAAQDNDVSLEPQPEQSNYNTPNSSGFPFLDSLVPSYLSIDTEGRVVRLDTFSKTVAPGCRLGWITTQPALCERIQRITETSTQQPSGFVQSLIAELLMGPQDAKDGGRGGTKDGKGWDVSGWVRWLEGLRGNYERRMQIMCKILESGKFLVKSGRRQSISDEWSVVDKALIYEFVWPMGGMFVWVKLNFETHPLFKKAKHERLSKALWIHLTTEPHLVLVAPGSMFCPTNELREKQGWSYVRVCFAAVDESEMERISRGFVSGCQSFWRKKNLDDLDESEELNLSLDGLLM